MSGPGESVGTPPGSGGMKVGHVGNLLGRYILGGWGSGLVLSMAKLPSVASIDLICPHLDPGLSRDPIDYPPKVTFRHSYDRERPFSILKTLWWLRTWRGDLLVFNMNTTSFGSRSSSNFVGIIMPIVAKILFRKPTVVIYVSSVLTTDFEKLGYSSLFNRMRALAAATVERLLFRTVPTFVLLQLYQERLNAKIPSAHIRTFRNDYIDAVPTIELNHLAALPQPITCVRTAGQAPTLLLHGYWGPQKDLEGILPVLQSLASEGVRFNLILSGAVNPHFPEYAARLDELASRYRGIISSRRGTVPEAEIAKLMTESDILLLSYNASGGQSGVMETAACFDLPTVVSDFPEYREKAATKPMVTLSASPRMAETIREAIVQAAARPPRQVDLVKKMAVAQSCVDRFLHEAWTAVSGSPTG